MRNHITEHDKALHDFISQRAFPCIGAKTAQNRSQITISEFEDLADERDNIDIISELYSFIENFDVTRDMFSSFVCVFNGPYDCSERYYEKLLWNKLQQLHEIDAGLHGWDSSVSKNPESENFSFSLGGEAFFIICLNPASRRKSRRYECPAIVFNLHLQFEKLRDEGKFEQFRDSIREREAAFNGSENSMLCNHGIDSEAKQYSGRLVEDNWQCPFHNLEDSTSDE